MRLAVRSMLLALLLAVVVSHSSRSLAGAQPAAGLQPSVVHLYGDANGETHLKAINVRLDQPGARSAILPGPGGVQFARFAADLSANWHTSDRRKYLVTLSGAGYEIEASDGTRMSFPAGSILLADDMKSKGHRTRGLGSESLIMYVETDDLPH